jgi:TIR domain
MNDDLAYGVELVEFLEENLDDAVAVTAALLALLTDARSYTSSKTQPARPLLDFAHELTLSDLALRRYLDNAASPVVRCLVKEHWLPVWKAAPHEPDEADAREYDVCISFAGADRDVARRIAERLSNVHERRVFYDEFEAVNLWGEDLFSYLHAVYSDKSRFCAILFSQAYLERAWTRHELRAAQIRVLEERESYVLPIALQSSAIPQEFSATGYWLFKPGDEDAIADALEKKVNDFIGEHFVLLDEFTESLSRELVSGAVLNGFRMAIAERAKVDDTAGIRVMTVLAVILLADETKLTRTARTAIDLVLFSPGPIGDSFDDENRIAIFGSAWVVRWLGSPGPLMLSKSGWEEHITEASRRWRQ